ncbi:MAG: leucyl aminopeptidase family protein [Deltaproteobacteria bacterium]|nr:MAG: leucyl aminopeptidase family protein [Deltaproteobacteria bacterium]
MSATLRFHDSPDRAAKGADVLALFAPAKVFKAKKLPPIPGFVDRRTRAAFAAAGTSKRPGDFGTAAQSIDPRSGLRFVAGILPDTVSRYNCAARSEAIRSVLRSLATERKRYGIVVVLDDPAHLRAAALAIGRALPRFDARAKPVTARVHAAFVDRNGSPIPLDDHTPRLVEIERESAELVDTPPSQLTPAAFAMRAVETLAALDGVHVSEIAGDALLEHGFGGIHAVGKGASSPPRIVIARYAPEGARRHVALVGKGICFDTGGLHLKGRGFMEGMKADMGGGAAVFGAFRSLVERGHPDEVTLLLCLAENAIGPDSYKPDDVVELHSGKRVEINNTDAEGRLLLADGVSYAARELRADVVLDAATLTGAQLIATGHAHAAVVANDADLEAAFVATGHATGELCHPLPFAPELYRKEFDSPVADMRNSVKDRMNAQTACAAYFVYAQIEDAPRAKRRWWGHVDLAGPAFRDDRGTGFGVALLADTVARLP